MHHCLCLVRNIPFLDDLSYYEFVAYTSGTLPFMERLRPWPLLFSATSFSMSGLDPPECPNTVMTCQSVKRTKWIQSKLSLQLSRCLGCFEWKRFYALLKHSRYGFQVLAGAERCTMTLCVNCAWKTHLPSRIRYLLLKSAWSLVLALWTLSLATQAGFPGQNGWQDHSTWFITSSVKILNRDGDRLERKKVASIRLWGFIFPTHTACAWGKVENNEHGSLFLRVFCFCKQKLEGKTNPC